MSDGKISKLMRPEDLWSIKFNHGKSLHGNLDAYSAAVYGLDLVEGQRILIKQLDEVTKALDWVMVAADAPKVQDNGCVDFLIDNFFMSSDCDDPSIVTVLAASLARVAQKDPKENHG